MLRVRREPCGGTTMIFKDKEGSNDSSLESDEKDPLSQPENSLEFSANAVTVLEKRYLKKDENGITAETPEEVSRRVAHYVASTDLHYDPEAGIYVLEEEFYEMMTTFASEETVALFRSEQCHDAKLLNGEK